MSKSDSDFYYDDPVNLQEKSSKKKFTSILAFLLFAIGGTFLIQTTLASNIALNTGAPVEFGQGTLQTVACSGASQLTITPHAAFTNASNAGAYYFDSITVSGIPAGCDGVDFTLLAYGNSDNAVLALFNSTSTNVVVYDNAGNFQAGTGGTGMTVASGAGRFTVTFDTPVAVSSTVFKVSIQSGPHYSPIACALGGTCEIGEVGPGGGNVFYYRAAGFSCGIEFTTTGSPTGGLCHYLEAAPGNWGLVTGEDPIKTWSTSVKRDLNVSTLDDESAVNISSASIGIGYKNTIAIVQQNGDGDNYAAGAAHAYAGGSYSDWYLAAPAEINQLCKWARNIDWISDTTLCTAAGALNSGPGASGFRDYVKYWTSSEKNELNAWTQWFDDGYQNFYLKDINAFVRPIRAF